MTQLAFVQEHALTEAQNRLKRLEWELQQAQQAAQQAQQSRAAGAPAAERRLGRRVLRRVVRRPVAGAAAAAAGAQPGLEPGRCGAWLPPPQYQQAAPPQPQPQYAPNYQPGMFQRSGSGFLGSALTTAAGVGGGILAAGNALMDLFSGHHGAGGGAFGGGFPGGYPGGGFRRRAGRRKPLGRAAGRRRLPRQDYVDQGSWDNSRWRGRASGPGLSWTTAPGTSPPTTPVAAMPAEAAAI